MGGNKLLVRVYGKAQDSTQCWGNHSLLLNDNINVQKLAFLKPSESIVYSCFWRERVGILNLVA